MSSQTHKIIMVSTDVDLIRVAKGAVASGDDQTFEAINKPIAEIGNELRDLDCQVLIVEIDSSCVSDFEQLQKITRKLGPNTALIVISENFNPAAARILIQLKVSDFLVKPLQISELVRACNNALKNNGKDAQIEPQFLTFMPASGGVGTTAIALETAAILNKHGKKFGRTTCVVDLSFQHGSCCEYLDIEPRFDINEIENAPERLDRQLLDVMLSKHHSGLSVIGAPYHPGEMRSFKSALVVRLLDLVSAYFDYVVIDLPRIWFPWTETVISGSNRLFILADMTVPSIRHGKRLMAVVEDKVGKQVELKILINRLNHRKNANGLDIKDVKQALGQHFAGGIPDNYNLVSSAVDQGVQLCEIDPNNNVTAALRKIILQDEASKIIAKPSLMTKLSANLFKRKIA